MLKKLFNKKEIRQIEKMTFIEILPEFIGIILFTILLSIHISTFTYSPTGELIIYFNLIVLILLSLRVNESHQGIVMRKIADKIGKVIS